jgi:hypothetical protein
LVVGQASSTVRDTDVAGDVVCNLSFELAEGHPATVEEMDLDLERPVTASLEAEERRSFSENGVPRGHRGAYDFGQAHYRLSPTSYNTDALALSAKARIVSGQSRNLPTEEKQMHLSKILDSLVENFATLVAVRAQQILAGRAQKNGVVHARKTVPCPVPGCRKPGFGPRNRYFCEEHVKSLSEGAKKKILDTAAAASGKTVVVKTIAPLKRVSPLKGATLNMRCRASERCFHRSKGPRFRFMCEEHYKKLTPKEQRVALAKWHDNHKLTPSFQKLAKAA